jgi:CubicO group peptidase (beta-lactamase class C family)
MRLGWYRRIAAVTGTECALGPAFAARRKDRPPHQVVAILCALMTAGASTPGVAAGESCSFERSVPAASAGRIVTRENWLAPEHLRVGLSAPARFMPGVSIKGGSREKPLVRPARGIDPDQATGADPDDGGTRSVRFLLETRLYADALIVLQGDQLLTEYYRVGFAADAPRLLLQATRPLLGALLAKAADRGRLAREKSVVRLLPEFSGKANLRKTSVQRLLDGRSGLTWSAEEASQWQVATGWNRSTASSVTPLRAWLKGRRQWPRDPDLGISAIDAPDGELLVWALEKAERRPAQRVLCDTFLPAIGAQDPAFWATDDAGTPLADGLALSIRDWARFGMALVAARGRDGQSAVAPRWFAESIAARSHRDDPAPGPLQGLGADVSWRYRFVGFGRDHQAAIVGPFGTSLYLDFDRKLVVALFASCPRDYSELELKSLRNLWSAIRIAAEAR